MRQKAWLGWLNLCRSVQYFIAVGVDVRLPHRPPRISEFDLHLSYVSIGLYVSCVHWLYAQATCTHGRLRRTEQNLFVRSGKSEATLAKTNCQISTCSTTDTGFISTKFFYVRPNFDIFCRNIPEKMLKIDVAVDIIPTAEFLYLITDHATDIQ